MDDRTVILIIDDEIGETSSHHQRAFLRAHGSLPLEFRFCSARTENCHSASAAVASINAQAASRRPDLILLDLKFGESEKRLGIGILREIGSRYPEIPVLVLSSLDRDVAALGECLEEGALGFVEKSASPRVLNESIKRALSMARSHVLVGKSRALRELRRQAARLSPYDQIPVLIVGERGTGKERVVRYIHHNGPRSQMPLIAVNCAAIPENLIEGEFFGSEKGAYTGATQRHVGFIERAQGGVLFLDEIGDMPLTTQSKLLRVLQDGTFRRIGSSKQEMIANFQLVCATNANVDELLANGRFRADFFDRIAAVTIRTPALRECVGDIPELAAHYLRQLGLDGKKVIEQEVLDILSTFDWPGNVRQLQRVIQELVVRSEDHPVIQKQHLPRAFQDGKKPTTTDRIPSDVKLDPLPDSPDCWPQLRLKNELELILAAKQYVQSYKGQQWKAEFMRVLYPHCKSANAKGFSDLIKRLKQGPWGDPNWMNDQTLRQMMESMES